MELGRRGSAITEGASGGPSSKSVGLLMIAFAERGSFWRVAQRSLFRQNTCVSWLRSATLARGACAP